MIQFNNGDKVKYRQGLTFIYVGRNPLKEDESYCIHPSTGGVNSLPTEDLQRVLTRDDVKKAVEYVFREKPETPKERVIKFFRGCVKRGLVSSEVFSHCGDTDCAGCNMMHKALREEVERLTIKLYDNEK